MEISHGNIFFSSKIGKSIHFHAMQNSHDDVSLHVMETYPVKVLLAFGETFKGNPELHRWLMENGYPELGLLSTCIRGDMRAFEWLMKNGFPELAALDSAIDNKVGAYLWLRNNDFELLAVFADACNRKTEAAEWLKERDLDIFLYLADCINHFRDNQYHDYHKKQF